MQLLPSEAQMLLAIGGNLEPGFKTGFHSGSLGGIGLYKLLWFSEDTGRVRIRMGKHVMRVWIKKGRILDIHSPQTVPMLKYLLVHNGFMTESIFNRCQQKVLRTYKRGLSRKDAVTLTDFMISRDLLLKQHRDELHRLLVEWQSFWLFTWKHGRYDFESCPARKRYRQLSAVKPEKIIQRFEQLLKPDEPELSEFNWQKPLNIHRGSLKGIPLVLIVGNILKSAQQGRLVIHSGFRKKTVSVYKGNIGVTKPFWRKVVRGLHSRFSFKNQVLSDNELSSVEKTDWFQEFFSPETFRHVVESLRKQEIINKRSYIRENTHWRASIGVFKDEMWDNLRGAIQLFVPIAVPLILALAFVISLKTKQYRDFANIQPTNQSPYIAANRLIHELAAGKKFSEARKELKGYEVLQQTSDASPNTIKVKITNLAQKSLTIETTGENNSLVINQF